MNASYFSVENAFSIRFPHISAKSVRCAGETKTGKPGWTFDVMWIKEYIQ
jgi:hypothetical protein